MQLAASEPTTSQSSYATIARVRVPELEVRAEPHDDARVVTTLTDRTRWSLPRALLVTERRGGWVEVLLPIRPNGSTGWARAADVSLRRTAYRIRIELSRRMLSFYDGAEPLLLEPVAIGKPETPTPVGLFYVTDPLDLSDDPHFCYGSFVIGLSAFSASLDTYVGGPGQIAIHGTGVPEVLGQPVSHGCVRIINDLVVDLGRSLPLGTPVEIVP